jgi:formate dehydrogenase major subunit
MVEIKLTINGKTVAVPEGTTILEAARSAGFDDIPTLCHDDRLKPYASCFLCVVEQEGRKNLLPSCATPVYEGMVIHTDSPKVREARKAALELLLSNHYADCIAPCQLKCPSNVDVQGYIALIAAGEHREAVRLIKEDNPFVATCGRVCTRPCEDECRRNIFDDRVSIDFLKRFASDKNESSADTYHSEAGEITGKRVAVVGAGPAGLTCAYYLAERGHAVEVFEAMEKAGGMLRYGIPTYRLPDDVLDAEIEKITELGVKINYNKSLGKDFSLQDLKRDYDSVFVGIGTQENRPMEIEGEDTIEGFIGGVRFLERCQKECELRLGGKVVVIGGGNTAIDCARTSLRLGADEVTLVYRRARKQMPALDIEVDEAEKEGVKFRLLAVPVRAIADDNGRLKALECIEMTLGEPDASGRRRPVPKEGSEFIIECDWAIAAIGQIMDEECIAGEPDECRPELNRWRTFDADMDTGATNIEGIFAGGDDVTGAATAIEAIAAGKKAAYAMHHYMTQGEIKAIPSEFISKKDIWGKPPEEEFSQFEKSERRHLQDLPVEERLKSFAEVETGMADEDAEFEVTRCLECGCASVFTCELKRLSTEYAIDVERYLGGLSKFEPDNRHPFIRLDQNKCILCGRCVRICSDEVVGRNVYGFVNRGFVAAIRPELEKPLIETDCESCGMCISACPTGAIEFKAFTPKPGPWTLEWTDSVCGFCSIGCELKIGKIGTSLIEIGIPEDGYACFRGRFGASFIQSDDRIRSATVDGSKVEIDEAIEAITKEIEKYDAAKIAVLVSPRLPLEDIAMAKKLAECIGTELVGSITHTTRLEYDGMEISTGDFADLAVSDAILLIDGAVETTHPVVGFRINKAHFDGAKLIAVGPNESKFDRTADLRIRNKRGTHSALLGALSGNFDIVKASEMAGIEVNIIEKIAKILGSAEKPVIIYSAEDTPVASFGDRALIAKIADKFGAKVILISGESNALGLKAIFGKSNKLCDAVSNGEIEAAISFGEDPEGFNEGALGRIIAVADFLPTKTTETAKIVLPLAAFGEIEGTFVNTLGEMNETNPAFAAPHGMQNRELLAKICTAMGFADTDFDIPLKLPSNKSEYTIDKAWFEISRPRAIPGDSLSRYIAKLKRENKIAN